MARHVEEASSRCPLVPEHERRIVEILPSRKKPRREQEWSAGLRADRLGRWVIDAVIDVRRGEDEMGVLEALVVWNCGRACSLTVGSRFRACAALPGRTRMSWRANSCNRLVMAAVRVGGWLGLEGLPPPTSTQGREGVVPKPAVGRSASLQWDRRARGKRYRGTRDGGDRRA